MKEVLNKVLKDIKPTKKEEKEVSNKVKTILNKINKGLKDAAPILGGSGIKGTWLRDAHDADIFVCFNYNKYKDKSDELSDILEKYLKKKFKLIRLHGSRDYFQIKEKNFTFEIIPILKINKAEQAKNITDVSPLHAKWVNKHKKLRDDIRLLKQFCKANNVYGAESYIKGFSGYICEILIVYYGSFLNVLKNAVNWKDKVIVDIEGYYKNKNIFSEINKSKLQSPLIIIDPVQADRNAAAAVSKEKFELFKKKAKGFLKNPSESFFEIKEINEQTLMKKAGKNNLILIDITPKKGKEDVIGCKLIKALEFINKKLKKNDFNILDYGWQWNKKALFYFIIKKEKLSDYIEREGPPLKATMHVNNFKKKYKNTFTKGNRIYTKTKREFKSTKDLIKSLKKDDYLKEKISRFTIRLF